jgi:hypothetical protein
LISHAVPLADAPAVFEGLTERRGRSNKVLFAVSDVALAETADPAVVPADAQTRWLSPTLQEVGTS